MTRDVRYDSQRIAAACTNFKTLGIRAWFTLLLNVDEPVDRSRREKALALWLNSTLGLLLHANQANRAQQGRGTGSKGMLESLLTLDVRKLQAWQLDEAQAVWNDVSNLKFKSFHQCAVDPVRIELDRRVVRDLLGLGVEAVASVARLRLLLANDPSIHGSKDPVLPS